MKETEKHAPKRILICANYFLPHKDGVTSYAASLATHLHARGHDITVLTFNTEGAAAQERWQGIRIVRLPCRAILHKTYTFPKKGKEYAELLATLEAERFDTVITNTRFFTMTWLGGALAKRRGARWVHVEHGNGYVKHQNPLVALAAWLVDQTRGRAVFRGADVTVGIAEQNAAFARRLGAKRTQVIANAIELEEYQRVKTDLRLRLHIPAKREAIVFVGRLVKMKGVHDLIAAMRGLDAHLIVVGDGPERARLERQASKLGVHASFLGSKPREGVLAALSAADLFVNPSYSEGLPTSVLEAGILGVPVIATDVGGTSEIVERESLFSPGDVAALRTLLKARPAKAGARLRLAARIREKFSWDATMTRFEALLR